MKTSDVILVVDLNGTLIKTDILQEAFWSSFSKDWKTPFKVINLLSNDKVKSPSDIIKCNFAIPLEDKSYKVRGNINGKTFEIIQEPAQGTQKKN